jgi:hypothetical protein
MVSLTLSRISHARAPLNEKYFSYQFIYFLGVIGLLQNEEDYQHVGRVQKVQR